MQNKTKVQDIDGIFSFLLTGPAKIRTLLFSSAGDAQVQLKFFKNSSSSEAVISVPVKKSTMLKESDFQLFLQAGDSLQVKADAPSKVTCSYDTE